MANRNITSLDEMFPDIEIKNIGFSKVSINLLVPFSKHPFRLYTGERLDDMVFSIKTWGILSPL